MAISEDVWAKIGSWSFLGGIVIAIIIGLYAASLAPTEQSEMFFYASETGGWVAWFLAILGVVVGLLSAFGMGTITKEEVPNFLLAGVALIAIGAASGIFFGIKPWIGAIFNGVAMAIAIFIAPVMGILSIKTIWDIGKD